MNLKSHAKNLLGTRRYHQLVRWVRDHLYGWHSRYYAEYGEDSIVNCYLHYKRNGFYVDVGAFHPKRLSSTYYFYKNQKWRGIIIEPNPVNCELFRKKRGRDIVVNQGASIQEAVLKYYMFEDASQNTFSEEFKNDRVAEKMEVTESREIKVSPLSEIIAKNIPSGVSVDYMNVDVEGLDLTVLQSNDWEKYRPKVITVEDISFDIERPNLSEIYLFLKSKNYKLKSVSHITLIFVANEFE